MITVWKYKISFPQAIVELSIPEGSAILHFDLQKGIPCIWVLVDNEQPKETRTFRMAGTGHDLSMHKSWTHWGTIQMANGNLVWHLFEVT